MVAGSKSNPGKHWAPKGISVWIVTYDHRHGTDKSAYGSEEKALRGALEYVLENLEDLRDDGAQKEIKDLSEEGRHQEALDLWQEFWHDSGSNVFQSIDIEILEVQ